jgi:hypothetical protein
MTAASPTTQITPIVYPSADGEPVAETYDHLYAILTTLETYEPITDSRSEPLKLRLAIEEKLIGFYREDTGEKLLIPDELREALQQETQARQLAEEQAEQERQRAEQEHQRAEQERQQRELTQQQLAEMEVMLDRYRERFGELSE